jgi:hypothetical protein
MEIHKDYVETRKNGDTFTLAEILKSTHVFGTSAMKNTQLTKFINIKQGSRPLEDLMLELDQYLKLLTGNYESKLHPGFIELEVLSRNVWLNAVDQTFFATKIDNILENTPDAKTSDIIAAFQLYNLQKGSPTTSNTDYSSTALSTTPPPPPPPPSKKDKKDKKIPPKRIPLPGPTPSGYCEYCWSVGVGFPHTEDNCRSKPKDWKPLNPKALVAEKDVEDTPKLLVASIDDISLLDNPTALPAFQTIDPFAFDSCATVSVTKNIANLTEPKLLSRPISLGGIASNQGAIQLTHIGTLSFMPPSASTCYFSKDASHNLISLGLIQKRGLSYRSSGKDHLVTTDVDGTDLDTATLSPNLLPYTSQDFLARSQQLAVTSETPTALTAPHYNAEQRMRCDRAEALHQGAGIHADDDLLCEELKHGRFAWANITPRDVRLNRELRGSCPQCLEGKMKAKPMPLSETAPATEVGGNIICDVYDLKSIIFSHNNI